MDLALLSPEECFPASCEPVNPLSYANVGVAAVYFTIQMFSGAARLHHIHEKPGPIWRFSLIQAAPSPQICTRYLAASASPVQRCLGLCPQSTKWRVLLWGGDPAALVPDMLILIWQRGPLEQWFILGTLLYLSPILLPVMEV